MSFAVDVNLPLYAFDAGSRHHPGGREFLESVVPTHDADFRRFDFLEVRDPLA